MITTLSSKLLLVGSAANVIEVLEATEMVLTETWREVNAGALFCNGKTEVMPSAFLQLDLPGQGHPICSSGMFCVLCSYQDTCVCIYICTQLNSFHPLITTVAFMDKFVI